MNKKNLLIGIFLLLFSIVGISQEKYTLNGYVKDAASGEELIGASIYIEETKSGTVTNLYGYYSITLVKGTYNLTYAFLGKEPQKKIIQLNANQRLDIELAASALELKAVEITAERQDANVKSTEMSVVQMEVKQIQKLPALLGEVDVLRTIQLIPGVQSGGDASTGFFVRGGSADQNLVLLDEAVVYNASHLFNFFSVFNSDAIKDLKLYKGGIPAQYGGRLSSVLDIRMKEGNQKEYHAAGGIGIISSRLTVEGPVVKDKGSFLVAGRRTYADVFLKLAPDTAQRNNKLYFYDLNTKLNYKLSEKDRLFVSGYFGRDVTSLGDLFSFDWGNATGTVRWNHLFSEKLFSNFTAIYSNYTFNIKGDIGPAKFNWNSKINDVNLKGDFTYYLNSNNTLRWGISSVYHILDPGALSASIDGALSFKNELSPFKGLEHGIYFTNEQNIGGLVSLNYGARFSAFQRMGDGIIYTYDKTDSQVWAVSDSLKLKKNEIYKTWGGFEPRVSARVSIDETSSIKASYNRIFQYIQQSQSSTSVAPYDVWYMASNNIDPMRVDQVAIGYFKNFKRNVYETSFEVYYKNMHNLTDVIDNADILGNEFLESQLRMGTGTSYGFEVLLKKAQGRFSGWIAYTWSKTERTIPDINNGNKYFAPFDRRNNLNTIGTFNLNERISISANFVYTTGRAITLPIGRFEYQGTVAPIYDNRNANRLPAYHRLDLSVNIDPKKKDGKGRKFESSWNFSVFNAYGRKNPISVSFSEDAANPGQPRTTQFYLPGPIPSITWNFKF